MKYLINVDKKKKVWGALINMKLPLVEKMCLTKVQMIPLTKQNLLKRHHYVHTIRKQDTFNLNATLGF